MPHRPQPHRWTDKRSRLKPTRDQPVTLRLEKIYLILLGLVSPLLLCPVPMLLMILPLQAHFKTPRGVIWDPAHPVAFGIAYAIVPIPYLLVMLWGLTYKVVLTTQDLTAGSWFGSRTIALDKIDQEPQFIIGNLAVAVRSESRMKIHEAVARIDGLANTLLDHYRQHQP